ncbi:peptidase family M20/M25/M40 protein [Aspergillus undulatus]|uniref:peptidase family M20/M25/M40 protein n=1 Tax=Aspergillus undulatus TaxID=1810928 RepID=UPI003CCE4941
MSLNIKPPQPSVSERRGQQLAPLQTNFSRPTSQILNVASPFSQRPRPSDYDNSKAERVPLQPERVKRQSSRSSLRHIFSREKPARKSADKRLSGIEEIQDTVRQAPAEEAALLSPTPEACDTPRAVADSTPTPATPFQPSYPPRSKLQAKHRAKTDSEDPPPAEDVAWKPPPLFKAYPQGLKHATLPAPILSGDSIMRLHATFKARGASLHDDDQANQPANEEPSEEVTSRKKKLDKEKQKYQRALSDNIEKGEWTQKIYIIATAGYILQYAGDGKHDRLPEKMLLLGPKSVAFASDAIPGKHWVLQVSQGSEEDSSTNPTETSRPLFSRFGFHRSHARRLARNLLLVFNDPEEMSSWLLAVRAQIEARGGKKYVTEKVYDEGMEHQLRSTPSMRQMVKKDPNRFSAVLLQPRQSMNFDERDSSAGEQSRRSSYISIHRRSMVMHQAPESRGSASTAQTEATEEPGRFYAALGSPPIPDGSVISESASSITGPTSPTFSTPRKRQSMFLPQARNSEAAEIPRAQSTVPDAHVRSASPPAPNFSVPLFSRRFAARQDVPHVPHLPSVHGSNQRDDVSIDTISMFSSPPQSPSRDGFHAAAETREPRRLDRRDQIKKPLRTSNSEDALPHPDQTRDRSRLRYSHLPEHITMLPGPSSSPRPAPVVKPVIPAAASHHPIPLAEVVNTPSRHDPSNRTDPTSRPSSIVSARRKSFNGLTAGPPSAPPPNVPLPKIPSAFVEPSPQSEHSSPKSPVEGAGKPMAPIPPVTANGHSPRTRRSIVPRPMNHRPDHDQNFF